MATKRYLQCSGLMVLIVLMSASLVFAGSGQRSLSAEGVTQHVPEESDEPVTPDGLDRIPPLWEAEQETASATEMAELPSAYNEALEASIKLSGTLSASQRAQLAAAFGKHEAGLKALQGKTEEQERAFGKGTGSEPSFGEMQALTDGVQEWQAGLDQEVLAILSGDQQDLYEASQLPILDPTDTEQMEASGLTGGNEGESAGSDDSVGFSTSDCYYGYYYHYYQYLREYYAYVYALYGYYATGNSYAYYGYYYCYKARAYARSAYIYSYYAYSYVSSYYGYYAAVYGSYARSYGYYGYLYCSNAYSATGNSNLYYARYYSYWGYYYGYYGYQNAYECYYYSNVHNILSVPLYGQEQNQWCWAGTAQMIMRYKSGYKYSQCGMANYVRNRTTCCTNPTSSACNYPTYLYENEKLYWGYGFYRTAINTYLSFLNIKLQINAKRPFFWGWYWNGGGGHAMAVKGYNSNYNYVYFNDPWEPQAKVCVYSSCVYTSGSGGHSWGSTIYNIYK